MSTNHIEIPGRPKRHFLPEDFTVSSWDKIAPFYKELQEREINSEGELRRWFQDRSELESVLAEDMGWRYIKMTINTTDEEARERFNYFISQIQPNIAPEDHKLNQKALDCPYLGALKEGGYPVMVRSLKSELEIFRDANIPLNTEIETLAQDFGSISGAMTVEMEGRELTLQQAADFLESTDRAKREEAYRKIGERRLQDNFRLDELFDNLLNLRHRVAQNADFDNFRDYMFKAMGRFDYTPQDCAEFHEAVKAEVVPLLNDVARERKEKLGLEVLRPWDHSVDIEGREQLRPFRDSQDLTEKTIKVFTRLDPFLGECLAIMREMKYLDLDSRKGKAPGGYNYPLSEIGVPFIFMNATSTLRDLVTILHEGGHAVHSFLTRELELNDFKQPPSEVAELASMSMELLTMDYWDEYFEKEEDLLRAKKDHLEQIIGTLPWVATIDQFQHWVYTHPAHDQQERKEAWIRIFNSFSEEVTDWSGLEKIKAFMWQKQLHLYEVPFYYIEYGMAQLGAVAIWKNYKANPEKALKDYQEALKLGYTQPIPEVYQAAGIRFDFSREYIRELMGFVKEELEKL